MKNRFTHHSIGSLFAMILLLVFTMFSLVLTAAGSTVYRKSVERLNENYTTRTAISYLSEKIRQHNSVNDIVMTSIEGVSAVVFRECIDGTECFTYVYFYDGFLRELFLPALREPRLLLGIPLVKLKDFSAEPVETPEYDSLLRITATDDNEKTLTQLIHCLTPPESLQNLEYSIS